MAVPGPFASLLLPLALSAILLGLSAPPSAATSILLSGQTLGAGGRLTHGEHAFVVGGDCNLALDDGAWQSGTAGRGSGCRLTLEGDGRLVVMSDDGATVWTSLPGAKSGEYVAVLETRGRVAVYGPAVWSAGEVGDLQLRQRLGCLNGGKRDNCIIVGGGEHVTSPLALRQRGGRHGQPHHKLNCLNGGKRDNCIISGAAPAADSVLLSGQVLLDGGCLVPGERCFVLRLDHRGGLAVVDANHRIVWSNNVRSARGEYVAVLRHDGGVSVYGPAIWSTAGGPTGLHREVFANVINRKIGDVKMVTDVRE